MFKFYSLFFILGFLGYPIYRPKTHILAANLLIVRQRGKSEFNLTTSESFDFSYKLAMLGFLLFLLLFLPVVITFAELGLMKLYVLSLSAAWFILLRTVAYQILKVMNKA